MDVCGYECSQLSVDVYGVSSALCDLCSRSPYWLTAVVFLMLP